MDQNYKRKRKENRLRQRLAELYMARTELYGTRISSSSDRALSTGKLDYWTVLAEQEAINKQITDIERRLFIRRD